MKNQNTKAVEPTKAERAIGRMRFRPTVIAYCVALALQEKRK